MGSLSLSCPHCRHDRVVLDAVWSLKSNRQNAWQTYMLCSHCGVGIAAWLCTRPGQHDESPIRVNGDISRFFLVMGTWPELPKLGAPEHTPQAVARRYIEGEDAFGRSNWNSAVAMYRSALDIATKAMVSEAANKMLKSRLEWMLKNGKLTQDLWEWADRVRLGGNDAIHDPDEFNEDDARPLRYFTEMFLRYVYELPGEVARLSAPPDQPA